MRFLRTIRSEMKAQIEEDMPEFDESSMKSRHDIVEYFMSVDMHSIIWIALDDVSN